MPSIMGQKLSFKITAPLIFALVIIMTVAAFVLITQRSKTLETLIFTKARSMVHVGVSAMEDDLSHLLNAGLITKQDLFDTDYKLIIDGPLAEASDPRYHTKYDQIFDGVILKTLDSFVDQDPSILFAILVDRNGYLPTHNSRYSLPLINQDDDLIRNRTKRIYDDPIGLAAAQFLGSATEPILRQVYHRDTGELLWDISAPVFVAGEHWGGFRLGLSVKNIESSISQLRTTVAWCALVSILSISFLTFLVVKKNLKPLTSVTKRVQRLASGHGDEHVDSDSVDEISALVHAFDDLSHRLQQTTISRDYYDLILESMREALVVIGCDGEIKSVNSSGCDLFGYQATELVRQHISILFVADNESKKETEEATKVFWSVENGVREFGACSCLLFGREGNEIWVSLTRSPLFTGDGVIKSMIWVAQDITQRRSADICLKNAFMSSQLMAINLEERNDQLVAQQQELEVAYENLETSQEMMVQQEKLASIGQLAAGIAHEVNNPIGFITSNLSSLRRYQEKLIVFIESRDGFLSNIPDSAEKEEITLLRKSLKLDFLIKDSTDLITESLDGAERIRKIVLGLKTFSRTDQSDHEMADINECFESTINIIWNELKYKTTLHRDYGQLPQTYCYPHKLSQVFMNLLINAGHAIETTGDIHIKTRFENNAICIWIIDTGCGIPEELRQKIFDPFFTTKDVGKGTGLGMSIAHEIIQQHHGAITLTSEVGIGTNFFISLPLIEKGADSRS